MSFSKTIILFFGFLLLFLSPTIAQSTGVKADDDEFNIFLLTIAAVFVCAMIGAAIIGAMVAAVAIFFFFALITIGVLSTSVAVGLYKRSFALGFKSFLFILFGLASSIVGVVGLSIARGLFQLPLSGANTLLIGFASGLLGGILMAMAVYKVIQSIFKYFVNKWQVNTFNS